MSTSTETNHCKCTPLPYLHICKLYDLCCIGCDKPGIGSSEHNPGDNSCDDLALCCCPCGLVFDIICLLPMCIGLYNVEKPH